MVYFGDYKKVPISAGKLLGIPCRKYSTVSLVKYVLQKQLQVSINLLSHLKFPTRTVRGSDYSPAIELSEQTDKLVTATGDTEKYSEKQANKPERNSDINQGP